MRFTPNIPLLSLLLAASSFAVEPALLLDAQLKERKIQFLGYADGKARFFGEDRNLRTWEADRFLQIEFEQNGRDTATPAATPLRLSDGQRLTGAFAGVTEAGNLRWKHPTLGPLELPLDRIASLDTRAEPRPDEPISTAEPAAADELFLMNNDRLTGFVESLNAQGLKLKGDDGQIVELPWNSVASLRLANPVRFQPAVFLWLRDGSRVRVEQLRVGDHRIGGTAFGKPLDLPMTEAWKIEVAVKNRIAPLRELPYKIIAGGTAFGVDYPPVFDPSGRAAALHAPVTLSFTLPTGAKRFTALAAIGKEDLELADMVLIVSDGQGELLRQRLNGQKSQAPINLELRDRTLTIQLDDATGGPIRDRLTLHNPAVLVGH